MQYQPNTNTLKGIYSNTQLYIIYNHTQTHLMGRTVKANSQLLVITYFFYKTTCCMFELNVNVGGCANFLNVCV